MGRESPGWGEGRRLDERASEWAGCYPCLPCRFWDFGGACASQVLWLSQTFHFLASCHLL